MTGPTLDIQLFGDREAQRLCESLAPKMLDRVMKPILRRSGKMLEEAARSAAPVESGILRKSIGATVVKKYGGRVLFATVGVRRGFSADAGVRRTSGPKSARGRARRVVRRNQRFDASQIRNPTKYLHLVTGGRKAIHVVHRKVLYSDFYGRFYGRSVAAVPPNPFMARAFAQSAPQVVAMAQAEAGARVHDLLSANP